MISDDSSAPSPEFLRQLRSNLPQMVKGLKSGKLRGKGIPVPPTVPRKVCPLCGRAFDYAAAKLEEPAMTDRCVKCTAMLMLGYTCLRSPHDKAFVKSSRFTPGEVLYISDEVMKRVKEQFDAEWSDAADQTDKPA